MNLLQIERWQHTSAGSGRDEIAVHAALDHLGRSGGVRGCRLREGNFPLVAILLPLLGSNNDGKMPRGRAVRRFLGRFQLFVYLFAPLCQNLKESDFQNFRLENGLKIWQAMWEFRHPDASCFVTHCKPKPKYLAGRHRLKQQFGDVFIGSEYTFPILRLEE